MKLRLHSKEFKRRQHKSWHQFFAIWPRRVSETEIAFGKLMRRRRKDGTGYDFRTLSDHAAVLLTNGTRIGDPYLKAQMEEYTRRYKESLDVEDD